MWFEDAPIAGVIRCRQFDLLHPTAEMSHHLICTSGCQSLVEPISRLVCQHHEQVSYPGPRSMKPRFFTIEV